MTTIPYTYLIGWTSLNTWYYGVRFAENCSPNDLWVKYFTSSEYVRSFIEEHGQPDIIKIRKTFKNKKDAIKWEFKVINKLKLHERSNFLNKNCAGAIFLDEDIKEKIRKNSIGNKKTLGYTNEYRRSNGMKILTGKPKGSKHSVEARKSRSERMKGKPVHPNCKRPRGINHSAETIEKLKEAAKNRKSFFCEKCNVLIKGKSNWDRHLKSMRHLSQFVCV